MTEHKILGFVLKRNGTKSLPWNIYYHNIYVGSGYTLKGCREQILDGWYEIDKHRINIYGTL